MSEFDKAACSDQESQVTLNNAESESETIHNIGPTSETNETNTATDTDFQESSSLPNSKASEETENSTDNPTIDEHQKAFDDTMLSMEWRSCLKCQEKFFVKGRSRIKCHHSKNICKDYSDENEMDPGPVPDELQGLSYIEEQLIARIHPILSCFKLKGHQFGYRGNVISFPQNVSCFAKELPHNINDLTSVITVRTRNELKPVDFTVNAGKVKRALQWLVENNPWYTDVIISEDNLNALPTDGNVYDIVQGFDSVDDPIDSQPKNTNINQQTEENNKDPVEETEEEDEKDDEDEDEDHCFISDTFIPMMGQPAEEQKIHNVIQWPPLENTPINEFHTPGYIAQAFPCLFPFGKADLRTPREKEISPPNYFKHLMRYKDMRFAKHPRFRFFAMNSLMRWAALKDGSIFVRRSAKFHNMTVSQLKEELTKNPNLIKKIMFQSSSIRGTNAYWYARGKELLAMLEQLGLATVFFTLSAADLHWKDLFKILAPDEDIEIMTDKRRRELVQENPMIVDSFFLERVEVFMNEVLKKKYSIKDLWFRIEYQHRGSPHVHGLLWLNDAPDVTNIINASEQEQGAIVEYFENLICTINPNVSQPPSLVHPCRKMVSEIEDLNQDLAEIINKVQRHTKCTDGYCLRMNKKTGKKECRFKFPKPLQDVSKFQVSETNEPELVTSRNDPLLNKFNITFLQTWRANIDISPVLSLQALVNYLAKYISKSEKQSKQLIDVLKEILQKTDEDKNIKNVIQRLFIQTCSERDYSAQETCHLLMGLKLYSAGGRKFVTVNFNRENDWIPVAQNNGEQKKTLIEKYQERSPTLEENCLWYVAKNYDLSKHSKYYKEAILQVFPVLRHKKSSTDDENEPFYKQQVLLYVPWRHEEDFHPENKTWKEIYEENIVTITRNMTKLLSFENAHPEEDEYDIEVDDDYYSQDEWMTISSMGVSQHVQQVELGRRDIDLNYDWHKALSTYEVYGGIAGLQSFILQKKQSYSAAKQTNSSVPQVQFNEDQQKVLDLLKLQIESVTHLNCDSTFKVPKKVIVQGKAGTGKSLIIATMKKMIEDAFQSGDVVLLLGPTGVSALNIGGSTIHSKLKINLKKKEVTDLKNCALHEFKEIMKDVKFIIIDEFSMIGCSMMHMINQRLKAVSPGSDEDFGGRFVYLFGDINQLPPVGDTPVYSSNQSSLDHLHGKLVYQNFDAAIILNNIQRQNDKQFQEVLNNISVGEVCRADFNFLKSRFTTSLSQQERLQFKDAIRLYPTKKQVIKYNKQCLESLKNANTNLPQAVARVPALHNCSLAERGSTEDAEGLFAVLYLAEGAKILLTMNLWTEMGLVNGSTGEIVHILYRSEQNPPDDPPALLVCKFDSYKGPYISEQHKYVVIQPITKSWTTKCGKLCTRTQFPLTLMYACTIHKSQGLTLERVFIALGDKEMATGLSYVAMSRAKSITGIIFEPFKYSRLEKLNKRQSIKRRQEWAWELLNTYAI